MALSQVDKEQPQTTGTETLRAKTKTLAKNGRKLVDLQPGYGSEFVYQYKKTKKKTHRGNPAGKLSENDATDCDKDRARSHTLAHTFWVFLGEKKKIGGMVVVLQEGSF